MEQPTSFSSTFTLTRFGVILGASIIVAASIVAGTLYKIREFDNTLSVTGSAKQKITSDTVKWIGGFSRAVALTDLRAGYVQMKNDEKIVAQFLKTNGVAPESIILSPVFVDQPNRYDANAPQQYGLRQTVEVKSTDVKKISALTSALQPLIDQGVIFATQSLDYYYTNLPAMRVQLLSQAVRDGQDRASKIAQSTGKKVGSLKSASVGVVQVMPVDSTDVNDYGTYDTSSIDKEVMVTVKAVFRLE